jgi:hypothetical protein
MRGKCGLPLVISDAELAALGHAGHEELHRKGLCAAMLTTRGNDDRRGETPGE